MQTEVSVLQPPHAKWFADLSKSPSTTEEPWIGGDLNEASESALEVSRASTRQRGALSGFGALSMAPIAFGLWIFIPGLSELFAEAPFMTLLGVAVVFLYATMTCQMIRLDMAGPLDEPIRFNRKTGKVYVYTFKYTQNPFGRWPCEIKVYNWTDIQGELLRFTQFNSRFLVIRYGLEAAVCKPGTKTVVERFWIEGSNAFPDLLRGKWAYICAYMNGTPLAELPAAQPRDHKASWANSFKTWLPWLAEPGAHFGQHPLLAFMSLLMVPFTPLFLVFAAAHYVAHRAAPTPKWPAAIDKESRAGD